ncbi:hypothetical protein MUK42_18997 [Musa troglodytarum]|uniref:50S ribosomal protein L18 n=1 Tax=Musa troglodytarum TaxID=320322 RepID=A0A9E7EVY0_9LILI|nr:hypothetical protein MUK42_18997 [Musa troglodytarum]
MGLLLLPNLIFSDALFLAKKRHHLLPPAWAFLLCLEEENSLMSLRGVLQKATAKVRGEAREVEHTVSAASPKKNTADSENSGMNWLTFELLWRDFFRFITKKCSSTKKNLQIELLLCARRNLSINKPSAFSLASHAAFLSEDVPAYLVLSDAPGVAGCHSLSRFALLSSILVLRCPAPGGVSDILLLGKSGQMQPVPSVLPKLHIFLSAIFMVIATTEMVIPSVRPPRILDFLKPYVLKMHITDKYVSAQVIHTPTAEVAVSASSHEKLLRPSIGSTRDIAAAAKIGKLLGERLLLRGIPAVSVFLKKEQKYHGKVKAVIDSVRDAGIKLL